MAAGGEEEMPDEPHATCPSHGLAMRNGNGKSATWAQRNPVVIMTALNME
jgi:hypothetical protein